MPTSTHYCQTSALGSVSTRCCRRTLQQVVRSSRAAAGFSHPYLWLLFLWSRKRYRFPRDICLNGARRKENVIWVLLAYYSSEVVHAPACVCSLKQNFEGLSTAASQCCGAVLDTIRFTFRVVCLLVSCRLPRPTRPTRQHPTSRTVLMKKSKSCGKTFCKTNILFSRVSADPAGGEVGHNR